MGIGVFVLVCSILVPSEYIATYGTSSVECRWTFVLPWESPNCILTVSQQVRVVRCTAQPIDRSLANYTVLWFWQTLRRCGWVECGYVCRLLVCDEYLRLHWRLRFGSLEDEHDRVMASDCCCLVHSRGRKAGGTSSLTGKEHWESCRLIECLITAEEGRPWGFGGWRGAFSRSRRCRRWVSPGQTVSPEKQWI